MARQKDANLFHCYIAGDIFRISTAKKVQDFDFTNFKSEEKNKKFRILILQISKVKKKIIHFMMIAIAILKKHLNKQIVLFDNPEDVHE